MGACRIAGLARSIGSDRPIPVARVGDDAKGGTGRLVVIVRRAVNGMAIPAAWQRPDIETRLNIGGDRIGERVLEPDMFERILTVAPAISVWAKAAFEPLIGPVRGT